MFDRRTATLALTDPEILLPSSKKTSASKTTSS